MTRPAGVLFLLASLMACEPSRRPVGAGSHPQSGTVQVSPDGRHVYVLSADHAAVLVVTQSGETLREIGVGEGPSAMARTDDGRLLVTNETEGSLSVVDPGAGMEVNRFYVGVEPAAVVTRGDRAWVALARESAVAEVSLADGHVVRRFELSDGEPRGLALVGGRLLVSHFLAGRISAVDLQSGTTVGSADMHLPSNPLLFPNQLASLTVAPDEDEVAAPHQEANNDPGNFNNGGPPPTGAAYYAQGPSGMPAVVPAVATLDPRTHTATSDTTKPDATTCRSCGAPGTTTPAPAARVDGSTRAAPAVHNVFDTATFGDALLNTPIAVAYVDGGRGRLVLYRGSQNVLLFRRTVSGSQDAVVRQWMVGAGADGIAVSPDGQHAYVYAQFDHTLSTLDLESLDAPERQGLLDRGVTPDNTVARTGILAQQDSRPRLVGSGVSVPANVDQGRRLFFGATSSQITTKGAVSCQSCHPAGRSDGMRWTFGTTRMRNTPALGGRISESAPFHWDGDRPAKEDMNLTVGFFMGGSGLDTSQLDQLWTFIDTLPASQSPLKDRADLQASITRGEALFHSESTQCATCHTGRLLTDNRMHNVGTSDREPGVIFGTPVLMGLAASAPYMHDGRDPTLDAVVENWVRTDRMGRGSHLTDEQAADLVHYLQSL